MHSSHAASSVLLFKEKKKPKNYLFSATAATTPMAETGIATISLVVKLG